jgi:monoterpene epsilon-lactone hydrolase
LIGPTPSGETWFWSEENPQIDKIRQTFEDFAAGFALPEDVETEPVDAGGIPAVWVSVAGTTAARSIFYLHGGGYMMGSATSYREMTSRIARASDAHVLVLDYRPAPEHPFPGSGR